jgi:hypothetical protein
MTDHEKALEAALDAFFTIEGQTATLSEGVKAAITVYLAQREADGFVEFPISIIEDLCSELEAEVQDRWGYDERLARQLDRDMETVNKARAMIAARPRGEG